MKYLLFLLFSSMESFSIVLLGLILFRIKLKPENLIKAISIGSLLATVSLVLTLIDQSAISPVVQIIVMFVLMKYLYQNKILYTLLLTVTPYILFTFIQATFIFITNYYGLIKFADVLPFTFKGYVVQFVSFLIVLFIASFLKKTNEGYAFVPEESTKKVKYSNKLLMFILCTATLLYALMMYDYKTSDLMHTFVILLFILSISAFTILFVSFKRDTEEFEF